MVSLQCLMLAPHDAKSMNSKTVLASRVVGMGCTGHLIRSAECDHLVHPPARSTTREMVGVTSQECCEVTANHH